MTIKVKGVKDAKGLIKVLEDCVGSVHFKTDEGDDINLKSTLGQFIVLSRYMEGEIVADLVLSHPVEDARKVLEFLVRG